MCKSKEDIRAGLETAALRLNCALDQDPEGMQLLIDHRVPVANKLADNKGALLGGLVVMYPESGHKLCRLGPVGLLNLALRDNDADPILATEYGDKGVITGFRVIERDEVQGE